MTTTKTRPRVNYKIRVTVNQKNEIWSLKTHACDCVTRDSKCLLSNSLSDEKRRPSQIPGLLPVDSLGYSQIQGVLPGPRGTPRSRRYFKIPGVLPDPGLLRDPGDTPYNEWAIPGGSAQKGYTFFWLQVCERVDISLVEAGGRLKG